MSENSREIEDELEALMGSSGEHRISGRDSSGNFKKGVSGNPKGRPKGTGKNQKAKAAEEESRREAEATKKAKTPVIDFEFQEGKTVAESVELNSARLMNACFSSIAGGNQRLGEIFFTQALKDKGQGQNPFAGLGDLQDIDPEEIEALANKIDDGDLDV
jgi:hypothetical protein